MKTKNVYAVMCNDLDEISVVMVFDDKESANMYKKQIEQEMKGCGYAYYIEDTKAIMVN